MERQQHYPQEFEGVTHLRGQVGEALQCDAIADQSKPLWMDG